MTDKPEHPFKRHLRLASKPLSSRVLVRGVKGYSPI
jgi:hypothetical protein